MNRPQTPPINTCSLTGVIPISHEAIHVLGRHQWLPDRTLVFDWPAVSIQLTFEGTAVAIRMNGGHNVFSVFINKRLTMILETDGGFRRYSLAKGLPRGVYELTLTKMTEPTEWTSARCHRRCRCVAGCCAPGLPSTVSVEAVVIDAGRKLRSLPSRRRSRRVEFVGDQMMLGSRVEACNESCFSHPAQQNALRSFAVLTAKALEAEYQLVACGPDATAGWCCWSSCCFKRKPSFALTAKYTRALSSDETSQHAMGGDWQADSVVIMLGARPARAAESEQLQQELAELVEHVSNCQPAAQIVCVAFSAETLGRAVDDWWARTLHKAVAGCVSAVAEPRVALLELQMPAHIKLEAHDWVDVGYLSTSGHKKVSQALAPELAKALGWSLAEDVDEDEEDGNSLICQRDRRVNGVRSEADDSTRELMLAPMNT